MDAVVCRLVAFAASRDSPSLAILARSFDPILQNGTPFELKAFGKSGRVRMLTFLLRFPVVISVSLGLHTRLRSEKLRKAVPWEDQR